ncbi:hypothetical protein A33M_1256 [Rhodovulum sp. PH10]|uniref:LysE family translocator n=1 Tax=Rhodovulum sp. PH10 TaxID=1187851 RepID=UPI00027C2104|nr:LysE family translocator [Rhodovulum sp. PH10]EJW09499.1 hypothetical protein A33M_1256 [Rhodovulum sp. PH10]
MNPELFLPFLLITLVLILTPGPVVTLMISTGATDGIGAVLATASGTVVGNTVLIGAVAFGLSFVLSSAAVLFEVIRFVGAAYLIFLGVQAWRRAGQRTAPPPAGHRVHFSRGFLVAVSNPKTAAFYTAFLPQFVDPALPTAFQLVVMVGSVVAIAAMLDSAWGVAAGLGRAWFMRPSRQALLARLSGTVLIGGGLWLLSRRPG